MLSVAQTSVSEVCGSFLPCPMAIGQIPGWRIYERGADLKVRASPPIGQSRLHLENRRGTKESRELGIPEQ